MTREEFEELVAQEFPNAIPEKFRDKVSNVAFIVEDEPSLALRRKENLAPNQTLLGYYHGVPQTARGNAYGVGATLPDTITLFQVPLEREAEFAFRRLAAKETTAVGFESVLRKVIRDTIWHEVGHHFGLDEAGVRAKEKTRGIK
jgi:predicted Zn-dependent protease with MMP-like domain